MTTKSIRNDEANRVFRRTEMKHREVAAAPFFVLGLFMPIDFIQSVPPFVFDLVRYGSALLILFMMRPRRWVPKPVPIFGFVAFLLIASGGLWVLKNIALGGDLFGPVVSFVSPLAAYLVVKKQVHHRWMLLGFTMGSFLSALDIILQASGLPFLGNPSLYGFRYSGFSYGSTSVAPLLAVAICVVLMPWAWKKRRTILRVILLGVLLVALFLSQGRGGFAGLIAALTVLIFIYLRRKPGLTIVLALVGGLTLIASGALSTLVNYVIRSDAPFASDFTSGRSELNFSAWEAFWKGGMLGVDPTERALYNPHIAPLSAALNIGPFGLVATSLICCLLVIFIIFAPTRVPTSFRMIASIALTTSLIEPTGFFVGFTGVVLVMLIFVQYREDPPSEQQLEQPNERLNQLTTGPVRRNRHPA